MAVSRQNVAKHNVQKQVNLIECDLITPSSGTFDLIVSNPPYIPNAEVPTLQKEVAHYEPIIALAGGLEGLSIIKRLLKQAASLISPDGAIMVEFNPPQRAALISIAHSILPDATCKVIKDLAGLDRLLVVELEKQSIG